jgi:hypothetical protein
MNALDYLHLLPLREEFVVPCIFLTIGIIGSISPSTYRNVSFLLDRLVGSSICVPSSSYSRYSHPGPPLNHLRTCFRSNTPSPFNGARSVIERATSVDFRVFLVLQSLETFISVELRSNFICLVLCVSELRISAIKLLIHRASGATVVSESTFSLSRLTSHSPHRRASSLTPLPSLLVFADTVFVLSFPHLTFFFFCFYGSSTRGGSTCQRKAG